MLCRLAWGNVARARRDYLIYLLTLTLGVTVFYAFNTISLQVDLADVDIDSNLRISPDNVKAARKLFRRLNQTFIIPGLVVEDGTMHFHPEEPCDLSEDDVSEYLGKGFSTIHAHAHMVAQLEAGRSPWKVLHSNDRDDDGDDEPGGMLEALRRMIS